MAMNSAVFTGTEPMDREATAHLLRALSEPTRLGLLLLLEDGEQRVTDLVAASTSSQANVSKHLACLRGCGLVAARPQGRETYYSIVSPPAVDRVLREVAELLEATGHRADLCVDHDPESG